MFDAILPVRSDDDVLRTAREVIDGDGGRGRTTWVLLLDDGDRLLPAVVPIVGMPVDPDPEDVARFADSMGRVLESAGAARVIVIWERSGTGAVRMQEADWAAGLAASGLPLRAQLLATEDGVRLLDPAFEAIVAG